MILNISFNRELEEKAKETTIKVFRGYEQALKTVKYILYTKYGLEDLALRAILQVMLLVKVFLCWYKFRPPSKATQLVVFF
jgi:hypothetical protein